MTGSGTSRGDGGLGLMDAVAIEVGLIVGGALFALVGVGVALSGPGVVVSFAIAITIAVLGLVPTAMLGASFPTTCGHYRYPARFVSPGLAFLAAWGLGISMFTGGLPLYALTAGEYAATLVPVSPAAVGVGLLTLFFLLNLVGIRLAARVQLLMFVGLVVALGSFVVLGVPNVDAANLTPVFSSGAVGIVAGAGVLYFTCLGANFVVDIGGEIRDATVTIPRSFLVSVPLVFVLYVLVALVAVGTVGVETMSGETLAVPAERFLSPAFQTVFVVGGALFAVATSLNATFILVPQYAKALAADGVFPAALGETNDRFGTAHWALLGTYLLSTAILLAPLPFADLGTMLAFGGAFVVAVVMFAAISVVRNPPADFDPDAFPVPTRLAFGMALLAVPLNVLLLGLLATQSPTLFASWVVLCGCGLGYYALRTNYYGSSDIAPTEHSKP
ncbi:APC family permease [Natronosalvus rutilus]|uniref:APC family permease n=1 Tax=Natronosalvus rutilus TaxID=2953753 RepID=A0A9E7SWJ8_9EURY|nr:APC family permease [Natronosalvus rutilus]UTF55137.1 APC family permease [Natronosalvus rutilus]